MSSKSSDPFVQGVLLHNQGKYKEALTKLNRVPAKSPLAFDCYLTKASCYNNLHDKRMQAEQNRKALEVLTDGPIKHLLRAAGYIRSKNLVAAHREIDAASKQLPQKTAIFYQTCGYLAREEDNDAKAVDYFTRASKLEPTFADAYSFAGFHYFKLHKPSLALETSKRAIKANPTNPYRRAALGIALEEQGSFSEAIAEYDCALKIAPSYLKAHEYKGDCYLSLRKWKKAIDEYLLSTTAKAETKPLDSNLSKKPTYKRQTRTMLLPISFYRKTSTGESNKSVVLSALAWLPTSVIQSMNSYGVSFVISPTVKEYVLSLKSWLSAEKAKDLHTVAGEFIGRKRIVVIGENALNVDDSVTNNVSLVLHECGHAYDASIGHHSDKLPFKLHYAQDLQSRSMEDRQELEFYLASNLEGCSQVFADIFAACYFHPLSFESRDEAIAQLFPRTYEYMRKLLPIK